MLLSILQKYDETFNKEPTNLLRSNTFASSNRTQGLSSTHQCHEREERRSYEHRIREVENGSFTPLVFTATGGMGKTAQTTCKKLVLMLAESGI